MARLMTAVKARGTLGIPRQQTTNRTAGAFKPAAPFKAAPTLKAWAAANPPAPPPPPPPAAMPIDPQYDADVADAAQKKTAGLAGLRQRAGALGSEFGYGVAFNDATGQAAAGAEDPSNPFSRRLMLQRAYATQRNVTGQSMGAAGQLYSGALENQNASDRTASLAQADSLQREFQARLAGLSAEGADVTGAYSTAVNVTAPGSRLARALAARPEDRGAGYDAYKAQAQRDQAPALPIQQWIDRGNPETTLTGRGAFGGAKLAAQFNSLPGGDQRAWRDYFIAVGKKGRKALLPSQWIAAGRPKS